MSELKLKDIPGLLPEKLDCQCNFICKCGNWQTLPEGEVYNDLIDKLSEIAMKHAVEVAEKAITGRCPACLSIINALKKESQ